MKVIFIALLLIFTSNNPGNWYVKQYYENGNLMEEGWLLNDKKIAYWFYYYEKGTIKLEGNYTNNLKQGAWKSYSEQGNLISTIDYHNDIQNGWAKWYSNNKLKIIGKYFNNEKDYFWKYFENNNPIKIEQWEKGKLVRQVLFSFKTPKKGNFIISKNGLSVLNGIFEIENNY